MKVATRLVCLVTVVLPVLTACQRRDPAAASPESAQEDVVARPGEVAGAQGEERTTGERDRLREAVEDMGRSLDELAGRARQAATQAEQRAREIGEDVDAAAARATRDLAERVEGAARSARQVLDRPDHREAQNAEEAVRATRLRLQHCDLWGTFFFFFEPGSAALGAQDLDHANQLNQCLARAERVGQVTIVGFGELETDEQSGMSLALSRAHNVAQRVTMGGAVTEGVTIQARAPGTLPEDQAVWGRRVEVHLRK